MVISTCGYVPVRYCRHERVWGVTLTVVRQTPQVIPKLFNRGIPLLARDKRYATGCYTWKNVAIEIIKS